MNLLQRTACSFADSGEQLDPPIAPSVLMVDDAPAVDPPEKGPLGAHRDARELVRLVQCPCCSKPFTSPVTLPCGHSVCRDCLPSPQPRPNISYPNTPDRQLAIACPTPTCAAEHPTGECNIDVTLAKLMELIKAEVAKHNTAVGDNPVLLEEFLNYSSGPVGEKERGNRTAHQRRLHGGRLVSTFVMADMGELHHTSDVVYHPMGEDSEDLDSAVLERLQDVAHRELDCLVCYNMMLDPTTTACGHTFCRRCLTRVMDHSNICPCCRRDLHIPASLQDQPSNERLVKLLNRLCPDLVASRAAALSLEEQPAVDELDVPLFVCTLSLPSMPTFLHIFEPRYRLMMRRCLEGNKQFGMIMYNRSGALQGDLGASSFVEYGTLLEIVNYELLRDGRSFVETRGVSRFKILAHGMLDGYDVGRVERVEDLSLAQEERLEAEERLAAEATAQETRRINPDAQLSAELQVNMLSTQDLLVRTVSFIERMRAHSAPWLSARILHVYGGPPNDPALFPYWFASVLPIAEEEKYLLLKTNRVRERLKMVNNWISRIEGQRWTSGSSCSIL
ncbi:ATP-dependent protease-like protein [Amniculicola lignicola CBS 123094]|uniref:ATP-dependent protease-like protein n=1 Tax=Amniculicola lignicola CBS 123094 TaxID=1392246 RepID=A0A6A5WDX8_9PLEO|nr:ATP-dependent protease-like protein [Amniculicola lignicola CBS 123094]